MGKSVKNSASCPCGKGLYSDCCGPLHAGLPADSAEALMRSRYAAYVLKLAPYLLATWHGTTRPTELSLEDGEPTQWLGLDVRRHATQENMATVEFVARYKVNGRACRLHESSRFILETGRWYYLDGEILAN
jgi:SEC-C motif-containing protein